MSKNPLNQINMKAITGIWKIRQQWGNQRPYSFNATFNSNGTILIPAKGSSGPFFGTYAFMDNQVSMAIACFKDPKNQSISAYAGICREHFMAGNVVGASVNGKGSAGFWSAIQIAFDEAEEKDLHIPTE